MVDLTTTGISVAYGALAALSAVLLVISLRGRRPGVPGQRPLLLSAGMACLLLQGLLMVAVLLLGTLSLLTFLLVGSVLEVLGVALFLTATLR